MISSVTFLQFVYSDTKSRSSSRIAQHVWAAEFTYFDVLVSVVAAVDASSGDFLSIGNLYFKLLLLLLLCSLS